MTLAQLAKEAAIARPLIRHHAGNREEIVQYVVDRFVVTSRNKLDRLIGSLPLKDPLYFLIDMLFDEKYSDPHVVLLAEALIAGSAHDETLMKVMHNWIEQFRAEVGAVVSAQFPSATKRQARAVASGVIGIYFNVDSMSPMGEVKGLRKSSKDAALMLADWLSHNARSTSGI